MKNRLLEIIGVLSLSFVITSTMAVSGGVPEILKDFPAQSRTSIEFLMSVPTMAIMIVIALTPVISRYISQHVMICFGLVLIGTAGIAPFFSPNYEMMLVSRIGLGIGIGFVNTYAVTLVGERFDGSLRQRLQGIRCSTETLGEASLIFIAGQLLVFGWRYSFLVYITAFIILLLYLLFVPKNTSQIKTAAVSGKTHTISGKERTVILKDAMLGFLLVAVLTSTALRTSSFVVESGFGSATEGSTVLSLSIFAGFAGGIAFGKLLQIVKTRLLPASTLLIGIGLSIVFMAEDIAVLSLGICLFGFFATVGLSYMFNTLSDQLSPESLTTANAAVLVGCNLGAATAPFQLRLISLIQDSLAFGFFAYACIFFLLTAIILLYQKKK